MGRIRHCLVIAVFIINNLISTCGSNKYESPSGLISARRRPRFLPTAYHAPFSEGLTSPTRLYASTANAFQNPMSLEDPSSSVSEKPKSSWGRFKSVLKKAEKVAASEDFQILAGYSKGFLKEIDVDVDVQMGLHNLKNGVDRILGQTALSLETILNMYEGRSSKVSKLLNRSRGKVSSILDAGLRRIMTEETIQTCLWAVNTTSLIVEEQAARKIKSLSSSSTDVAGSTFDLVEVQQEVMDRMVMLAEDVEAVASMVIHHPFFKLNVHQEDWIYYENILKSRIIPRLILTVAAAVLHGWRPLDDPLFALLVVCYASSNISRKLSENFFSIVEKAFFNPTTSTSSSSSSSIIEEALPDLWHTKDTTQEIGSDLFGLFQALAQRGGASGYQHHQAWKFIYEYEGKRKYQPSPYTLPSKLSTLGATMPPSIKLHSTYYPLFERSTRGAMFLYMINSVHTTRHYWREILTALAGTFVMVVFARSVHTNYNSNSD